MLTLKEYMGDLYHAKYVIDPETDEYAEETEFILDEYGELIPAHICLCWAHTPAECCCATTSWEGYEYDEGW